MISKYMMQYQFNHFYLFVSNYNRSIFLFSLTKDFILALIISFLLTVTFYIAIIKFYKQGTLLCPLIAPFNYLHTGQGTEVEMALYHQLKSRLEIKTTDIILRHVEELFWLVGRKFTWYIIWYLYEIEEAKNYDSD